MGVIANRSRRLGKCCLSAVLLALPQLAAAEISGDVIKIGVLADVRGTYSQSSGQGSMVAVELAAEDFGGEIDGKPIQVVLGDSQNKPDVAEAVAKQWHVEGVDMITDMPSSAVALKVQEAARYTQMVIIHNGAGTELLTGKFCSPRSVHWQYNTGALSSGTGVLAAQKKNSKWFVITLDHPFGRGIYNDVEKAIAPHGGKIVGSVFHGFTETNFFPIIEKALDSGADVIAFGNAGKGLIEAIRQSKELGVALQGKEVVSIMTLMQDIRGVGLYASSGMRFVSPYYWNVSEGSRAFAERFRTRMGTIPSEAQLADYTAARHYLRAVQATGSDRGDVVVAKMKELKVEDGITQNGYIRRDGRLIHDMNFMQVKQPSESKGLMDYFKRVAVIPGEKAFAAESADCPLVAK
jgi:branched-chain amino acid transport system substrate-binding protein